VIDCKLQLKHAPAAAAYKSTISKTNTIVTRCRGSRSAKSRETR